jgi:hypothetical protein
MPVRIVQINFKYNVPRADFEQASAAWAHEFAALPGLRWKIWIVNEEKSEAGGIFLFDDQAAADAFAAGPLAAKVHEHPALSDFSAKQFDVRESVSAMTHGPI